MDSVLMTLFPSFTAFDILHPAYFSYLTFDLCSYSSLLHGVYAPHCIFTMDIIKPTPINISLDSTQLCTTV